MKAKLIKVDTGWILMVDNKIYASHNDILSLKNCQAIERGYDLDELLKKEIANGKLHPNDGAKKEGIKRGIQIALELMGDDVFNWLEKKSYLSDDKDIIKKEYTQQKEWDVEIETEKVKDETKIVGAVKSVKGSGNKITTYKSVPKLNADGCLILKRI